MWLDHLVAASLIPLAVWILLSGLDDVFIGAVHFIFPKRRFRRPGSEELRRAPERRIAMFVPLWREHRVIRRMLEHNLSTIGYHNYDIFVGVYPNDFLTERAVAEVARRYDRVHLVKCAHDGPTCKGDCLNNIYSRMKDYEKRNGIRFEIVVIHDAEDLVHGESLRLINWFSRDYDMVQVPVLPLPTSWREWTHGVYCDEFAESGLKDIPVRRRLGGFLPSNGVGTGFARSALERLPGAEEDRIFDPKCLTEDYEIGCRLFALGCPQLFVPVGFDAAGPIATREYFPRTLRAAVRQRSRWVAGNSLQAWERHGWRNPPGQIYWFWRDRKGLVGNLLSPFTTLTFVYGLATRMVDWTIGDAWHFGSHIPLALSAATLWISVAQAAMRIYASARVYGGRFALAAPARMLWGNVVNSLATAEAVRQFFAARIRRHALVWRKTEHVYPPPGARENGRLRLGQILVGMERISLGALDDALLTIPKALRLGEHLLGLRQISEDDLYRALSIQAGIPFGPPDEVDRHATRALPAAAAQRWRVLPYKVEAGQLHLVASDLPSEEMLTALSGLSSLGLRFRLVPPRAFEWMAARYLPRRY